MLRPSTFPEVGALRGGDDPEPTWCSRRWLHPLILSETGPPEAVRAGGRAGVVTSSCRRAGFASHRLPSGSRRAGPQSRSGEVIGSSPAPEPLRDVSRAFPKPSHSAARLTGMGRATPAVSLVSRVLKSYWAGQDRRRRRRVRDAARRLVPEKAWSGEKATAPELACLTLLHLLWLQDQTRRAARVRNTEGAALLARSAVETVIAGLYCLNVPGAAKRYDAGAGKDLKKLFAQFTKAADVGTEVLDDMLAFLGPGGLPLPATMVSDIAANSGPAAAQDLYRRYYVPLSAMYAHAGPLTLLRHVHPRSNRTRERPFKMWSRRSASHTADAMVGFLAATIAGPEHPDYGLFCEYHAAHWPLAWPPSLFVVRHLALRRARLRHVPGLVMRTRALRAERLRGERLNETEVEELISRLYRMADLDRDDASASSMTTFLRTNLLSKEQAADGDADPA